MQVFAVSALMLFLASGTGTNAGPPVEVLVQGAASEGMLYQFAKNCGATEVALKKFEAANRADIADMKAKNRGVDFDAVYAKGKTAGAKRFTDLGPGAKASEACSSAIALIAQM